MLEDTQPVRVELEFEPNFLNPRWTFLLFPMMEESKFGDVPSINQYFFLNVCFFFFFSIVVQVSFIKHVILTRFSSTVQ